MGFIIGLLIGFVSGVGCGVYYRRKIVEKARDLSKRAGQVIDEVEGRPQSKPPPTKSPPGGPKYQPPS